MILLALSALLALTSCTFFSEPSDAHQQRYRLVDRDLDVWTWRPIKQPSKGVILFSHGAASAPWKYETLIRGWQQKGYEVHAPLHVDSTDHPETERYKGLLSWQARLEDFEFLANKFGQGRYIAAGHSYGALLALTKGGASPVKPKDFSGEMSDERVSLVLAFSPPSVIPGFVEHESYETIDKPALIQTGTNDIPPGSDRSWRAHLDAYQAAPASGSRYALVLNNADHYFGGEICRPELTTPKQTEQLEQALGVSVLMVEAYHEKNSESLSALIAMSQTSTAFSLEIK